MKMYKRIQSFIEVEKYVEVSDKIIICYGNNHIETLSFSDFRILWQTDNFIGVNLKRDGIISLVDTQYIGHLANTENGQIDRVLDEKFKGKVLHQSFFDLSIYHTNHKNGNNSWGVYDFKSDKLLWEKPFHNWGCQLFSKNLLLVWQLGPDVKMLDAQTGLSIWQYSVSQIGEYTATDNYGNPFQHEGEVRRVIGICKDILILAISGGYKGTFSGSNQLIGLSSESGELLWQLDMFQANGIETGYGSYENLQISADNAKLLGFYSQGFIEIDVQSGRVLRFNHLSYSFGETLQFAYKDKILTNVYCSTLFDDHLFFTATNTANRRHSLSSNVIGAYNYKTEIIEWLNEFEEMPVSNFLVKELNISGTYLCARTTKGTLYIFEKLQGQ